MSSSGDESSEEHNHHPSTPDEDTSSVVPTEHTSSSTSASPPSSPTIRNRPIPLDVMSNFTTTQPNNPTGSANAAQAVPQPTTHIIHHTHAASPSTANPVQPSVVITQSAAPQSAPNPPAYAPLAPQQIMSQQIQPATVTTGPALVHSSYIMGPNGMPIRGSSKAPKTFRGHYTQIEEFIKHLERLFAQHQINLDSDKVKLILDYCSTAVRNFIKTTQEYINNDWTGLKSKLMESFDAERKEKKYTLVDVIKLVKKTVKKPIAKLEKWKKYVRDYETIAGNIHRRRQMADYDYNSYFWSGIHPEVRRAFAPILLVDFPAHNLSEPYKIDELNMVAEKYFKRDKFSDMLPNVMDWDSDSESDSDSDSDSGYESSDSDSDDEYRRRKSKKKKKLVKKRKDKGRKKQTDKETLTASKTEVDKLVESLNRLTLLNMNHNWHQQIHPNPYTYAASCSQCGEFVQQQQAYVGNTTVAAPITLQQPSMQQPMMPLSQPPMQQMYPSQMQQPPQQFATYPNSIPLGQGRPRNGPYRQNQQPYLCFGCFSPEHMLGECPRMQELMQQGVLDFDHNSRKFCMKQSRMPIFRRNGESLYKAAMRLNSVMPPHNMQAATHLVTVSDYPTDEAEAEALHTTTRSSKKTSEARDRATRIPKKPAREVFDGVYPPPRKVRKPKEGPVQFEEPTPAPVSEPVPPPPTQIPSSQPVPVNQQPAVQPFLPPVQPLMNPISQTDPPSTHTRLPTTAKPASKKRSPTFDTRKLKVDQDIRMAEPSEPIPRKTAKMLPKDPTPHHSKIADAALLANQRYHAKLILAKW
ncbi:hypothetical protein CVT26_014326 [Gymnopilus dilepis]|uniref:Uncharacterized protein n=1 Tax=Gymnopilus dilepis TaxID=231916 RepID=A0A409WTT7_9AGAR|nr:hypothetical protein CVT26_014326 [Gymnopilus dilepis]